MVKEQRNPNAKRKTNKTGTTNLTIEQATYHPVFNTETYQAIYSLLLKYNDMWVCKKHLHAPL